VDRLETTACASSHPGGIRRRDIFCALEAVLNQLADSRDCEQAIADLVRIARRARSSGDAASLRACLEHLAFLNWNVGRLESALRYYIRLIESDTGDVGNRIRAARVTRALGRPRQAVALLSEVTAKGRLHNGKRDRRMRAEAVMETAKCARVAGEVETVARLLERCLRSISEALAPVERMEARLLLEEARLASGRGRPRTLAGIARRLLRTHNRHMAAAAALAVASCGMGDARTMRVWRAKAREWAATSVGRPFLESNWQLAYAILRRIRPPQCPR